MISSSLTGRRGSLSLGRSNSEISTRKPLWRRRQRSFVKTLDRELTEHSVLVLPEGEGLYACLAVYSPFQKLQP